MASRAKLGVERETPMSNRLRSYKRKKHVSPVSTSGPSGHLAAHEEIDLQDTTPSKLQNPTSGNSDSSLHSDTMSEGDIVRPKNRHQRNGGDDRFPLLQKNIIKSAMRFERLNHHTTFLKKCMARNIIPKGLKMEKSISVMATNDTRRTRLDEDIEKILKSSSRRIMKAILTYYEEAVAAEQANMDSLSNELALMEMSRAEVENYITFTDSVIDKRCLLRSKLEEKRKNKLKNLQESLLRIPDDPVLVKNRGKNRRKGRKRRRSGSRLFTREIIPSCSPKRDNDNLRQTRGENINNSSQTRSKDHSSQASSLSSPGSTNQSRAPLLTVRAALNRAPTSTTILTPASSLSSSGSTNQSRAPLLTVRAALNRAPTSTTVITPAPPTSQTFVGDSHREHAVGRHYRRKHSAKRGK